jgi:hypothetical protein
MAAKLECSLRSVAYYLEELRAAGLITIKKRQHSSAEYRIQTGNLCTSGCTSGCTSEPRYPYMSFKLSGSEVGVPVIQRKPQHQALGNWSIPTEEEIQEAARNYHPPASVAS